MRRKIDISVYIKRFATKLKRNGECIEFNGCRKNGYGNFNNPYEIQTHRFSWLINKGPIPAKTMVLHKCDNPSCVRIDHLWLGNQFDNMQDMKRKNRHHSRPGEKSELATISEETAKEIIKLLENDLFAKDIAKKMNVSTYVIYAIKRYRSWKHLNRPEKLLSNGIVKGSRNNFAKLNEEMVKQIRNLISKKEVTIKRIAELYKIHEKTIYNIKNKKSWAHLPE